MYAPSASCRKNPRCSLVDTNDGLYSAGKGGTTYPSGAFVWGQRRSAQPTSAPLSGSNADETWPMVGGGMDGAEVLRLVFWVATVSNKVGS